MDPHLQHVRMDQTATYEIKIQGRLAETWAEWFGSSLIAVASREAGPATTTLTATVADQAALFGLLSQVRDLGLPLLSVQLVDLP